MLIISCEHASNAIPTAYQTLFATHTQLLKTHQAYDIGALELAELLALSADYYLFGTTSRLLVELNRSLHHPSLFSTITKPLTKAHKQQILTNYYLPYQKQLVQRIQEAVTQQPVIHIAVHSFTPILNGQLRNADIGLLYDSRRSTEKDFCQAWKRKLLALAPHLKIRSNYPYQGKADGMTTYLRKQFSAEQYIGIELEVNQKYPLTQTQAWQTLKQQLKQSLASQIA